MARERITLISEQEERQLTITERIQNGEITKEVYETLSPEEQSEVRNVLFALHSEPAPPPVSFSSLEFAIFGLAKLFFKVNSGVPLTIGEQAFYDRFNQFIEQHEITMDAGDWYVPYAEYNMLLAKENRAKYKEQKLAVTGDF